MKLSRLLAYAAGGIIVGLLLENKALLLKSDIDDTTDDVKRKARTSWRKAKKKMHMHYN